MLESKRQVRIDCAEAGVWRLAGEGGRCRAWERSRAGRGPRALHLSRPPIPSQRRAAWATPTAAGPFSDEIHGQIDCVPLAARWALYVTAIYPIPVVGPRCSTPSGQHSARSRLSSPVRTTPQNESGSACTPTARLRGRTGEQEHARYPRTAEFPLAFCPLTGTCKSFFPTAAARTSTSAHPLRPSTKPSNLILNSNHSNEPLADLKAFKSPAAASKRRRSLLAPRTPR